jgi:DNA primase
MPVQWVVDYYNQMADKILPFFKGRDIDINQIFDHENVFRRHEKDGKKWIRINDKKRLAFWTDWHAWSFYPHLEGDKDLWFALDVDPNKCDFDCVKIASFELANILDNLDLKYLIKFSGNKGFHFLFSLGAPPAKLIGEKIWEFERGLISFLREKLEEKLQKSKDRDKFYKFLKKDDPITIDKSSEEKEHNSILLDKLILHKHANIRSPYSLHEKTKLVSLPINKEQIMDFEPKKEADPKNAAQSPKAEMPKNNIAKLIKKIA